MQVKEKVYLAEISVIDNSEEISFSSQVVEELSPQTTVRPTSQRRQTGVEEAGVGTCLTKDLLLSDT